jgi:trehalose 6-phosphate phosphatase
MSVAAQVPHAIPLLENLNGIEQRVASAAHIGLFLDFDGTLSRIVSVPQDARLEPGIRTTLEMLAARADFTLAIVSGRSLADVRARVGIEEIIYIGNHGLEIESESIRFREPQAEALRRELRSLALQLKLALCDTEGLEVEDKGLTLSVHFRRVAEEMRDWVRNVTCSSVTRSRSFQCREGKLVLEVFPRLDWNKGRAVKWIAREVLPFSALRIYAGDDVTDEDVFAAISEGITIRVGDLSGTAARYSLADVASVGVFLQWLDRTKPNASRANSQRAGK